MLKIPKHHYSTSTYADLDIVALPVCAIQSRFSTKRMLLLLYFLAKHVMKIDPLSTPKVPIMNPLSCLPVLQSQQPYNEIVEGKVSFLNVLCKKIKHMNV